MRRLLLLAIPMLLAAAMLPAEAAPPLTAPPRSDPPKGHKPKIEKVELGGETFKLELAVDDRARRTGLMGRTKIADDGGMLFVYRSARLLRFWMGNCLIDIDILYLDSRGRILAWYEMKAEPPRGQRETLWDYDRRMPRYSSKGRAQYAIELKAGTIKRLELHKLKEIELDFARLRKLAK